MTSITTHHIARSETAIDAPGYGPLALHVLSMETKTAMMYVILEAEPGMEQMESCIKLDQTIVDTVKHLGRVTWENLLVAWIRGSIQSPISKYIAMPINSEYILRTFNPRTRSSLRCRIIDRKLTDMN